MWLTRFAGSDPGHSPGIAYQGSLSSVPLEMTVGDNAIASPAAAMVVSPRTTVTQGQQSQNVNATLPVFQPGNAPVNNTTQVPKNPAINGAVLGAIIVFGLIVFSRMKVR